jgi:hypothetical protein
VQFAQQPLLHLRRRVRGKQLLNQTRTKRCHRRPRCCLCSGRRVYPRHCAQAFQLALVLVLRYRKSAHICQCGLSRSGHQSHRVHNPTLFLLCQCSVGQTARKFQTLYYHRLLNVRLLGRQIVWQTALKLRYCRRVRGRRLHRCAYQSFCHKHCGDARCKSTTILHLLAYDAAVQVLVVVSDVTLDRQQRRKLLHNARPRYPVQLQDCRLKQCPTLSVHNHLQKFRCRCRLGLQARNS